MPSERGAGRFVFAASLFVVPLFASGLRADPSASRQATAQAIADASRLRPRDIQAGPFLIRAYERVEAPRKGALRVYIEGDGLAWIDQTIPSLDPTPIHPLGLSLAAADPGANVVYLARPCQYTMPASDANCESGQWTSARFSGRIIASMQIALNDVMARYRVTHVELVGYSGGGAVAVLLAAQRRDIDSIRTVAGNLDIETFAGDHQVSPLVQSLNPADAAGAVATIPQLHFIGSADAVVPSDIYASYVRHAGAARCVHAVTVPGATHGEGWVAIWPQLLGHKPVCS